MEQRLLYQLLVIVAHHAVPAFAMPLSHFILLTICRQTIIQKLAVVLVRGRLADRTGGEQEKAGEEGSRLLRPYAGPAGKGQQRNPYGWLPAPQPM